MIQANSTPLQQRLDNEAQTTDVALVTDLNISRLVIEDDTLVDSLQAAQQQRLLVEPLYWVGDYWLRADCMGRAV